MDAPSQLLWFATPTFGAGTRVGVHVWKAKGPARHAPLFVVHGIGEHALRYADLAGWLAARGYDVYAPDLPGHGKSASEGGLRRCYGIDEMADLCERLRVEIAADGRYHVVSHSMGALVSLLWRLRAARRPLSAYASAPPLALRLAVPGWKRAASKLLFRVWPDLKLTNEIDPEMLSYDSENVRRYREDPFVHPYSSARQYESILAAGAEVSRRAGETGRDLVVAIGADDPIVDVASVEVFARAAGAPFIRVASAKHEILNEASRVERYEEILAGLSAAEAGTKS